MSNDERNRIAERFNQSVLQAVVFAKAASINAKVDMVYLESFIIGILNTGKNEVTSILVDMGVNLQKCLHEFKKQLQSKSVEAQEGSHYASIQFDKDVVDMCHEANIISENESQKYIGLEHIFEAILNMSPSIRSVFEAEDINVEECIGCIKNSIKQVGSFQSKSQQSRTRPAKAPDSHRRPTGSALRQFCINMML